jgi:hypothetical protein
VHTPFACLVGRLRGLGLGVAVENPRWIINLAGFGSVLGYALGSNWREWYGVQHSSSILTNQVFITYFEYRLPLQAATVVWLIGKFCSMAGVCPIENLRLPVSLAKA